MEFLLYAVALMSCEGWLPPPNGFIMCNCVLTLTVLPVSVGIVALDYIY